MRSILLAGLLLFVVAAVQVRAADGRQPDAPATPNGAKAEPAVRANHRWQLAVGAAGKDGTKPITATLNADAPIPSGFGEVTPRLILRYRSGRTAAYVVFDTFLGEGELDVTVTFGSDPAEVQKWTISSDGRAAFVPGEALTFAERLKRVKSFSVQFTPRKRSPITVAFSPADTDLVIKALISAGVKYGG